MKWDNNKYNTSFVQVLQRTKKENNYIYRLYWETTQKTETIKTYIVEERKGYERILTPKKLKGTYIHRYLMKEHLEKWAAVFNCNPSDLAVHHIDEDRTNNTPSNLMVLTPLAHKNLHSSGIVDEDRFKKISDARKGVKLSEEHKKNISKALKGRTFTEEHKRNLALAHMKDKKEEVRISPLDTLQSVACGRVFDTPLFLIIDLSKSHIIPCNRFGGLVWSKKRKLKKKEVADYLNVTVTELNKYIKTHNFTL